MVSLLLSMSSMPYWPPTAPSPIGPTPTHSLRLVWVVVVGCLGMGGCSPLRLPWSDPALSPQVGTGVGGGALPDHLDHHGGGHAQLCNLRLGSEAVHWSAKETPIGIDLAYGTAGPPTSPVALPRPPGLRERSKHTYRYRMHTHSP